MGQRDQAARRGSKGARNARGGPRCGADAPARLSRAAKGTLTCTARGRGSGVGLVGGRLGWRGRTICGGRRRRGGGGGTLGVFLPAGPADGRPPGTGPYYCPGCPLPRPREAAAPHGWWERPRHRPAFRLVCRASRSPGRGGRWFRPGSRVGGPSGRRHSATLPAPDLPEPIPTARWEEASWQGGGEDGGGDADGGGAERRETVEPRGWGERIGRT
jgi:hypothetical protein